MKPTPTNPILTIDVFPFGFKSLWIFTTCLFRPVFTAFTEFLAHFLAQKRLSRGLFSRLVKESILDGTGPSDTLACPDRSD